MDDKKSKRTAAWLTVGVNALILLLLFVIAAWRAPNPPLPEYGIELNFGLETQGSGDVQPQTPTDSENIQEESEQETQPTSDAATATPTEQIETPATESLVSAEQIEKTSETLEVNEKKVEQITDNKNKEDTKAIYKPTEKEKSTTNVQTEKNVNHGDDENKKGDKGSPTGSLDAKALYGKQGGGGGGSSLELNGWNWDVIPKPDVPENEQSGRIVFEIKVDEYGEIISIRTLEKSVSLAAEKACRAEIEKLTFTKTGQNVPAISTGKITFVIRTR